MRLGLAVLACSGLLISSCGNEVGVGSTCELFNDSTLPGVHFETSLQSCTFSLAQARAGLEIPFQVVVDGALADVNATASPFQCGQPNPSGLFIRWSISGGDQRWDPNANGFCDLSDPPIALSPGGYDGALRWDGRNLVGEGDEVVSPGADFPAGEYQLELSTAGEWRGTQFQVHATAAIALVP